MDNFSMFFKFLSALNNFQILLILLFSIFIFLGPGLVKKRYLRRVGLEIDERVENRNEWILFPSQYNLFEKILMMLIYIGSFFLLVIMVNN